MLARSGSAQANAKDVLWEPDKGQEAVEYAAMHSTLRVQLLKALCEMRLDREDVRAVLEDTHASSKPPDRRFKKREPPKPQVLVWESLWLCLAVANVLTLNAL